MQGGLGGQAHLRLRHARHSPAHLPAVQPGASQLMSRPSGLMWPMGGSSSFSACLLVQGRFWGVLQSSPA